MRSFFYFLAFVLALVSGVCLQHKGSEPDFVSASPVQQPPTMAISPVNIIGLPPTTAIIPLCPEPLPEPEEPAS